MYDSMATAWELKSTALWFLSIQLFLDLDYVLQEWLTEMSPPAASGFSPIPALPWGLDRNHYVLGGCPLFLKPVP